MMVGDPLSANAELSSTEPNERARLIEQDESADRTQAKPWAPIPTAFDSIETSIMDTAEDEIPTRPVTPSRINSENADSLAYDGGINCDIDALTLPAAAHTSFYLLPEQDEGTVSAGSPKCAVCGANLSTEDYRHRVIHFNQCWSRRWGATVSKNSDSGRLIKANAPANICILCNTILDDLASIDEFEHRIHCLKDQVPPPTACPRCNIYFAADGISKSLVRIAQHLYVCSVHPEDEAFAEVQSHWCERQNKRMHPENCGFCSKALANLDVADAFYHRRTCFERTQPTHCPICSVALPGPSTRRILEEILWHVYNCQNDNRLSIVDRYDQKKIEDQSAGRIRLLCSFLSPQISGVSTIGPRKNWGHKDHTNSYRRKWAAAKENGFGLYRTSNTNLRAVATHTEDDRITLMKRVRVTEAIQNALELFRRSAYCVFNMPKYGKTIPHLKAEYETHEVVYSWHEELEMANVSTSYTTLRTPSDEQPPRSQLSRSYPVSERSSCRLRRSLAMEIANKTGIPIPPSFESDIGERQAELSSALMLGGGGGGLAMRESHIGDDTEQ